MRRITNIRTLFVSIYLRCGVYSLDPQAVANTRLRSLRCAPSRRREALEELDAARQVAAAWRRLHFHGVAAIHVAAANAAKPFVGG